MSRVEIFTQFLDKLIPKKSMSSKKSTPTYMGMFIRDYIKERRSHWTLAINSTSIKNHKNPISKRTYVVHLLSTVNKSL